MINHYAPGKFILINLLPDPKSHITAQVVAQASERIGVANGAAKLVGKESVVEVQAGVQPMVGENITACIDVEAVEPKRIIY